MIKLCKTILIANKEAIMWMELIKNIAKKNNTKIIPVDLSIILFSK